MAQQFLDMPYISLVLEHKRGAGIPEGVSCDVLIDLGFPAVDPDQLPHPVFRHFGPIHGKK